MARDRGLYCMAFVSEGYPLSPIDACDSGEIGPALPRRRLRPLAIPFAVQQRDIAQLVRMLEAERRDSLPQDNIAGNNVAR